MENAFSIVCKHSLEHAELDVIFIHGLTGNSAGTWGDPPQWLSWVSEQCNANVFVADYPSKFLQSVDEFSLLELGRLFDDAIESGDFGQRPMAMIVHSLGGVLLKKALQHSIQSNTALAKLTKYVCFIATPHKGSSYANLLKIVTGNNSALVGKLSKWSEELDELAHSYRDFANNSKLDTSAFYEKRALGLSVIVERISANPDVANCVPIGVSEDHLSICKLRSESATVFTHTRKRLQILANRYKTEFREAYRYNFLAGLARQKVSTSRIAPNKFALHGEVTVNEHNQRLAAFNARLIARVDKLSFVLNGENCLVRKTAVDATYVHIEDEIKVEKNGKHSSGYSMEVLTTPLSHAKLELLLLTHEDAIKFRLSVSSADRRAGQLADAVTRQVLRLELATLEKARFTSGSRNGMGVLEQVDLVRNGSGDH